MYSISYMLTYIFVYLISLLCMDVYLFLFRKYILKIINFLKGCSHLLFSREILEWRLYNLNAVGNEVSHDAGNIPRKFALING